MNDAIHAGLDAYARGDYRAAAEAWVRALKTAPADKWLLAYVHFLRKVAGEIVAEVETSMRETAAMSALAAADPWGAAPTDVVASEAAGVAFIADRSGADREPSQIAAKMREATELDDFSLSLTLAEELLSLRPGDQDAIRVRDRARVALTHMSVNALGSLEEIPRVKVPSDQIIWLDLDQRDGFVLSQVDGISTYNDIVSVTAMDELETLGILARLARDGIIGP
ncbi:MAG: hypothetical protein H7Z43_08830 [Clostridia bacterium]|nr:hypothetical protein [Deltaproteobacteria bacterium]